MGRRKSLVPPEEKPLTRRQEKFVKELVANDGLITMREAAVRAGAPAVSAHSRAYEMVRMPHVARAIAQYRAELDEMYAVNYKRAERDLKKIRDASLDAGAYSAAVQAEYRRGQAQGDIYVNKSEIRHGSIDQMSRDDVEKELDRIRQSYEPTITIEAVEIEEPNAKGSSKSGSGALEVIERRPKKNKKKNRNDKA